MRMRTLAVPTAVIAALSVSAVAPSFAQSPEPETSISGTATVTPNRAGTKKKPQSVNLQVKGKVSTTGEDGVNKPIVQRVEILFPKGSLYAGGKLPKGVKGKVTPKCTEAAMLRGLPAKVCPKGSIVGKGSGNAWADTVTTKVDLTFVNGGANMIYAFTELTNPAVVQLPVPGKIKKMSGKWAYKLTMTVPDELQVVAGVPISLIDFNVKTKSKNWLFTTSCPSNKKWPFEVTSFQNTTKPAHYASTTKCR
jgi:hypothetical protein